MTQPFVDVPLEAGTRVLLQAPGYLDDCSVLYQYWSWEDIEAESLIFDSADVTDLSDDALQALVAPSPVVKPGIPMTISRKAGYTFVNFNFVVV
jgi:hypothetical protein